MTLGQEFFVDRREFGRHLKRVDRLTRHRCIDDLIAELSSPIRTKLMTVREEAAKSLGELRADAAADSLLGMLSDPDENVRFRAAQALGLLGRKDQILLDRLSDVAEHDPSELVRAFAIQSLGQIGDPSIVDDLLQFLSASESRIRFSAMYALFLIPDAKGHRAASVQFELEKGSRQGSRRRLMRAVRKFERKYRT